MFTHDLTAYMQQFSVRKEVDSKTSTVCRVKNTHKMSELNISVVIMRENVLISGEIYTAGKKFTLLLAVTAVTTITSATIVFTTSSKFTSSLGI